MLLLPRSARLAAWGTAVLAHGADAAQAVAAVTRDDEPHELTAAFEVAATLGLPPKSGLTDLLTTLSRHGTPSLRVALPAPGDLLGLPGPGDFNATALDAGECVLSGAGLDGQGNLTAEAAGPAIGIVPTVTEFGSVYEPGAMVSWQAHAVGRRRVTDLGSVAEADRELRSALAEAIEELGRLDVARWRDDAADRVAAIRDGGLERGMLPPSTPPRCVTVLARAARVRAIVELAAEDDGAAVSQMEARRRTEALRRLDGVARRAMVAAVNGMLEPQND
ncbi:hypothetical protein KIH74_25830 [Kineosporia sp. J2-2]|uniref:Uncharacterized protein n=1 Tax=Kineosporia corallincola TaxID=2835133 RepID=A0ABS5TQE9_9ACTN|nr:hypothetical protein [Kineosporia corallincola]MBT0772391.1 hypothetical protein [Kineosporia corallincola]